MVFANMANKCTEIRELVDGLIQDKAEGIQRAQMDAAAAEERINAAAEEMQRAVEAADMARFEQAGRQKDFYSAQLNLAKAKLGLYDTDNVMPAEQYIKLREDVRRAATLDYNALCSDVLHLVQQAEALIDDYNSQLSVIKAYIGKAHGELIPESKRATLSDMLSPLDLPNMYAFGILKPANIKQLESYVNTLKNA